MCTFIWRSEVDSGCLFYSSSCFLRQGLSLSLMFIALARLTSQTAPRIHLSLSSHGWDQTQATLCLDFYLDSGDLK